MAVEIASAYVSIIPSMRGAQGAIARHFTSSSAMAEADSAGRSIGSRMLGGATKALAVSTAAVGALGAAVTGLAIKGGISRQLQIEDAQSKLVSLGHNTQAVQTIMDDALKAVKGTAYGLGDAATMAATAVAAGVKPGEELQKYLSLVGDAATVAGVSMGEMGQIFGKVQTSGRAYTTELNQLADRGIPIYQWLAEEYGVTALELRKMVSAGQVDAETYRKVIEENIGGAALQMGSTTRGAFANMMAALSRVGVQLTQWFFPLIKTVFNAVTGILDGVTDVLKPFSEAFSEAFQAKAGPAIEAWGARAIDWLGRVQAGFLLFSTGEFSSEIREALGVEEDAPLVGTLLRARDLALEVTGGFSAMFGAYKAGGSDVTSAGFAGVLERVGLGARWARDEVVGGVQAMVGAFRDGGTDVTSSGFAGVLESLGLIARSLWDAIGPTLRELGPTILTTAAAFSPFLIALDGIVPVLPVIGESLAAIADSIGGVLLAVLPVVAKAFADVGVVLSGAISAVLPSLVIVLEAMAVSLVALTPAIVAVVPPLAALIVKAVELVTPLLQIKPLVIAAAAALVVWKSGLIGSTAAMARNTAAWVANASAMVVSAAQTTYLAALYAKDFIVSAVRSTAAVARQSAAWVANTAALLVNNRAAIASSVAARASAVATNAAALATRAFNLVLRANPIGLIVTAVTGLVGALVWFFTKTDTGRKIVAAAWSGIQSAISSVTDWFTGSVMPVLTASWDAISAGAMWLYDHAIKPAWAGIQSAISVAWGVIKPIVDANVAIFKFLGDVFWNVSTLVIQASWLALQASFRLGWAFLRDSVIKPLRDAWNAVGTGFSWVWTAVIQPAWAGLQAGLAAGWLWIRVNVFDPVNTGVAAVGSAFDATRVAVGVAWDLIILAAGAAWNWIRDNVFAPINSGVDTVGDGFSLAGETIGLAWEAIRAAGKSAWDWIRENIFAPFGKGIEAIGTAFNSARDVVSAAWDAISDAAVKPVNFVIETVYTGGIKKLFDTVAEKLGLPQRLPALSPIGGAPSNSSSSRPINRGMYYAGGVLPGYTPGADVHHFTSPTAGQLSLSGGEAIMVPEWTRAVGGPGAVAAMNAAARQGAGVRSGTSASYWGGGIWDAVKRGAGAAWDFTTDAASAIGNFMRDPVAGAVKVFTAPIEALLKEIGGGSFGEVIAGAPRALVNGIVDGASRIFGPARDDGTDPAKAGNVTPGASPMGIAAMTAALQAMLPGARVTSGLRRGATVAGTGILSMHGMGRAIDIGSPTMAMFNKILGTYPGATELLFSPAGARQRQRGRGGSFAGDTSGVTKRMHYDHIHWGMKDGGVIPTLYDDGGWLKPGISVVENRTNKPEPVLTSNQWQTLDKTQNDGPVLHYHAAENKSLSAEQELRAAVNRAAAISGFGGHG